MSGVLQMFEVADLNGKSHHVYSKPQYVFNDTKDYWLTVAVCATDEVRKITLVEFKEGDTTAVNRLWVSTANVDFGESHANKFPAGVGYPVVRIDLGTTMTAWEERVKVVIIENTHEAAQLECDRLNRLTAEKRFVYFCQPAVTVVNPIKD